MGVHMSRMNSTIVLLLVAITTLALAGIASAEDTSQLSKDTCKDCKDKCKWVGYENVRLIAGQHIDVGSVNAKVVGDYLYVTFKTTDGWKMTDTHLYVGTEKPSKHAPGQFPYKSGKLSGVTSYTYKVPLSDIVSDCSKGDKTVIYLAAHADVKKPGAGSETAWGEGDCISVNPQGKCAPWAMYFDMKLKCICDNVKPPAPR